MPRKSTICATTLYVNSTRLTDTDGYILTGIAPANQLIPMKNNVERQECPDLYGASYKYISAAQTSSGHLVIAATSDTEGLMFFFCPTSGLDTDSWSSTIVSNDVNNDICHIIIRHNGGFPTPAIYALNRDTGELKFYYSADSCGKSWSSVSYGTIGKYSSPTAMLLGLTGSFTPLVSFNHVSGYGYVSATNNTGETPTAISFNAGSTPVYLDNSGNSQVISSALLNNGSPASAIIESPASLSYIYEFQSTFSKNVLDISANIGYGCSLAIVNGSYPAIVYVKNQELLYTISSSMSGDSVADWSTPIVLETGLVDDIIESQTFSQKVKLIQLGNGNPAIGVSRIISSGSVIEYYCSTTVTGSSTGDWKKVTISSTYYLNSLISDGASSFNTLNHMDLLLYSGRPTFVFVDHLGRLVAFRSDTLLGSSTVNWSGTIINRSKSSGLMSRLGSLGGVQSGSRKYIVYSRSNDQLRSGTLTMFQGGQTLAFAEITEPRDEGTQLRTINIPKIDQSLRFTFFDTLLVDNRPAIFTNTYYRGLVYYLADDVSGNTWSSLVLDSHSDTFLEGTICQCSPILLENGYPAVFYHAILSSTQTGTPSVYGYSSNLGLGSGNWTYVDMESLIDDPRSPSMIKLNDGTIGIVATIGNSGSYTGLRYLHSTTQNPTNIGDWNVLDLNTSQDIYTSSTDYNDSDRRIIIKLLSNGYPAIFFKNTDNQLFIVRSTTETGSSLKDWIMYLIHADVGENFDVQILPSGLPFITYYEANQNVLACLRTTSTIGAQGTWKSELLEANTQTGKTNSVLASEDAIRISYYNETLGTMKYMKIDL